MKNPVRVAGGGAVPKDPKKPLVQRPGDDYKPVEKINEGPNSGGGTKSVTPGHGQPTWRTKDAVPPVWTGEDKNELASWTMEQQDPYRARGEDWASGHSVEAAHGQSSGAEKLDNNTSGKNTLA